MSKSRRYSIIGLCALLLIVLITWYFSRSTPVAVPPAIAHGYAKALKQARNGEPGAARVLYQQLARPDLSDERRVALHAELPNYPSPQALKLADKDWPMTRRRCVKRRFTASSAWCPRASARCCSGRCSTIRNKTCALPPPTHCSASRPTPSACISGPCSRY